LHYLAVLNRDGGTLRTMDLDVFCAEAREIFEAHGHVLDCRIVSGADVEDALREAAATEDVDVMLAGGGDGTISTAAEAAFQSGKTLAVLPAGTMNLFARTLKIPLDLHEALHAIASGETASVDIATANGEPFVHQFSVGIHARLVRIRDGLTYRSRIGKMMASLRAISAAAIDPPRFEVEIVTPRGRGKRKISGISVSNNPFGEGHFPHADSVDAGVLGVYIAAPMTTGELTRLTFDIMLGNWRASPMISQSEVSEVTLTFPRRKRTAQAVIDGELIKLDRDIHIVLHPRALQVVVPHKQAPAEAA
jgi:diacylglycerol kinase family enzyme